MSKKWWCGWLFIWNFSYNLIIFIEVWKTDEWLPEDLEKFGGCLEVNGRRMLSSIQKYQMKEGDYKIIIKILEASELIPKPAKYTLLEM